MQNSLSLCYNIYGGENRLSTIGSGGTMRITVVFEHNVSLWGPLHQALAKRDDDVAVQIGKRYVTIHGHTFEEVAFKVVTIKNFIAKMEKG